MVKRILKAIWYYGYSVKSGFDVSANHAKSDAVKGTVSEGGISRRLTSA